MVNKEVKKIVCSDRWVYNSDFHDVHLLDIRNVQKLISMCRFTKPNVLFSDVVKKINHFEIRTQDTVVRRPKAKIPKSTSVQWYGNEANQTDMQVVVNRMNKKLRPCDSRAQPSVKNVHSELYCDSIDTICDKNHFEVLSVEDCVSDKCNPSVIVDLKGDGQRHTSNTVNVKKSETNVE